MFVHAKEIRLRKQESFGHIIQYMYIENVNVLGKDLVEQDVLLIDLSKLLYRSQQQQQQ